MRKLLLFFSMIYIGLSLSAQTAEETDKTTTEININCDSILVLYYKNGGIKNKLRPITDYDAFCKGVKEAYSVNGLGIKFNKEKFDIKACTRFAYEEFGVSVIGAGKAKTEEELDSREAYNFSMHLRMKEKLKKQYVQVGKLPEVYFGPKDIFSESFYNQFNKKMTIKEVKGNKIKVKLKKDLVFPEYLYKIKVNDRESGAEFVFEDFFNGVTLPVGKRDKKEKAKLFNFSLVGFDDPYFCRASEIPDVYIVWLSLKEFYGEE